MSGGWRAVERAASQAYAEGRLDDAVELLAGALGRPWRPEAPLALRHKPSQDLLYARHWREDAELSSDLRALRVVARALARARSRAPALLALRGTLRLYARDLEGAVRDLSSALRARPALAWARGWRFAAVTLLARREGRLGAVLAAAPELDRALADDPSNPLALALRAEFLHDRERYDEALRDLDALLAAAPGHSWALSEKGEILSESGRHREARSCFAALVKRHPREAWAYAMRGRAQANGGRPAVSLRDFDRAIVLAPRWAALHAWRGEARRKTGDWTGAFEDFDECLRIDPGYLVARAWRGHASLLRGRLADALSDLDAAVRSDCRQMLFYAWRGEALLRLGLWRRAADDFDRCHPFHPRTSWTPRPGMTREEALFADLDRAAAGGEAWPCALRGRFLLDSPRREEGLRALGAAAANRAVRAWAMGWFGEGLRREKRQQEARACLEVAVKLSPGRWLTRARLARVLLDLGRPRAARPHAAASVRARPDHPFSHAVQGEVLWRLAARRQAVRHLETARLLGSRDPEVVETFRQLGYAIMPLRRPS